MSSEIFPEILNVLLQLLYGLTRGMLFALGMQYIAQSSFSKLPVYSVVDRDGPDETSVKLQKSAPAQSFF